MRPARLSFLQQYRRHADAMDRLFDDLSTFDAIVLRRRPADGGWSALQTLYHVLMAEQGALRSLQKKRHGDPRPYETAGLRHAGKSLLLRWALYSPLRFKAPTAIRGELLPDDLTLAGLHAQWQALRPAWLQFIEDLPDEWLDKAVYRHPRAGYIGWNALIAFLDYHRARHTRQVYKALK
jgi:hypothetical protein